MAGIYIHIPFCKQACFYCDFHFSTSMNKKNEMINALRHELKLRKEELRGQTVETIYFGGGTPSILSSDELQLLIDEVFHNYLVSDSPEITLEANPDDLSQAHINAVSKTPINRLSIGIQSFYDDDLKSMNRAHSAEEAKRCLELSLIHFDNITIDLIYGLPNMPLEKWYQNLKTAFNFGVPHISSYALTIEPKTALDSFIKKGKYPPLDEELALKHFELLVSETKKNGFIQYEISNFAKPSYFSKHNTSYWQGKSYLGIGPSAHSYNGNQRSWNVANNVQYIQSIRKGELPLTLENLSKKDKFNEYIMTGLRTIWGILLSDIENQFGLDFKEHILRASKKNIQNGFLVIVKSDSSKNSTEILTVSERGKFLVDGLASDLFMI